MGLRERVAKALLPAGALTQTEQQIAQQVPATGTTATPLDRAPEDYTVPFAPGRPLIPSLINPPREDGRADPRRYEYPVAWNLQITETRDVPFRTLRQVADGADLVRKCIQVVKNQISGMDWDIVLTPDAIERIQTESSGVGSIQASKIARQQLMPEILRCKEFWKMPDRINGMSFTEWVGVALEEMLVIDALSIYPNKTVDNENLHSLEILDGSSIKPLLDDRGGRPLPPYPAFQQILWGFPRGEFTASADADGEFSIDDLVYAPRTRRTYTPYGYSAVEQALPVIDLYMKRIQWLRTEFTDGVTPQVFLLTDAMYGNNPELLRAYERVFNDDMAGKMEARRRARILPEGIRPEFSPSPDKLFDPAMDELLVKMITGHFGIGPTQVGFAPKGGLGGAGVQKGEGQSNEEISLLPTVIWLTDLLNQLSYRFLSMPKDLTFQLSQGSSEDDTQQTTNAVEKYKGGVTTLNETRDGLGLPMLSFPEADMPLILNTMVPLADVEELVSGQDATGESEDVQPVNGSMNPLVEGDQGDQGDMTKPDKSVSLASIELAAFAKWTKGARKREFVFEFLDGDKGKSLNVLAKHDPAAARELANVFKADDSDKSAKASDRRGRDSAPGVSGGEGSDSTAQDLRSANPGFSWTRE